MFNYNEVQADSIEYLSIAKVDELAVNERLFVEIDDLNIMLVNIAGKYFAIGDVCSHDDGPLGEGDIEDHDVICPRHGARFDLRTGKAKALPAYEDIPAYPVRIVNDQIEIGIPLEG